MNKFNQLTVLLISVLSLSALQGNAQNKTLLVAPTDRTWYHTGLPNRFSIIPASLLKNLSLLATVKYYGLIVEKLSIIFIRTKASSIGDGLGPMPLK